jgi:uncharacterized protein (DUF433 family)
MGYGDFMDRITVEPGQRSNPRIRETPITVWVVYRALSLPGMTDSEVHSKYPELKPDDLAAVREFAAVVGCLRCLEELPGCRFEIPFDTEAAFAGNRNDLYEHAEEMWHKPEQG